MRLCLEFSQLHNCTVRNFLCYLPVASQNAAIFVVSIERTRPRTQSAWLCTPGSLRQANLEHKWKSICQRRCGWGLACSCS